MLVRECVARGSGRSRCCPGPSAVVTALVASGLPAERWRFAGFLPRKAGELRARARSAATRRWSRSSRRGGWRARSRCSPSSTPSAQVAVCRELTKLHEEVVRGPAREVAERFAEGARGEIVLVIGPGAESAADDVAPALRGGRGAGRGGRAARRRGAKVVSRLTGVPANRLYRGLGSAAVDLAEYRREPRDRWERMAPGWERELPVDVGRLAPGRRADGREARPAARADDPRAGRRDGRDRLRGRGARRRRRPADLDRLLAEMVEAARRRAEELGLPTSSSA